MLSCEAMHNDMPSLSILHLLLSDDFRRDQTMSFQEQDIVSILFDGTWCLHQVEHTTMSADELWIVPYAAKDEAESLYSGIPTIKNMTNLSLAPDGTPVENQRVDKD